TMAELALEKTGYQKKDAVLIGDRLYTDIACGVNAKISTIFVLSGEGTLEDLEKSEVKPQYVYGSIKQIYQDIVF
ncbi:MAG: HAD hydrolase-like protein, partial [Clostridia bacterium]|nr:HAD hydrolase-like protein [Clostridia bacterium]